MVLLKKPVEMTGTEAYWLMFGKKINKSRQVNTRCRVLAENEECYFGHWLGVEGTSSVVLLRFPKYSTHPLAQDVKTFKKTA